MPLIELVLYNLIHDLPPIKNTALVFVKEKKCIFFNNYYVLIKKYNLHV